MCKFHLHVGPIGSILASVSTLLEKVRADLNRRNEVRGELQRIAKHVGLSYKHVRRITFGDTKNPGVVTLERINDYLRTNMDPKVQNSNSPQGRGSEPDELTKEIKA